MASRMCSLDVESKVLVPLLLMCAAAPVAIAVAIRQRIVVKISHQPSRRSCVVHEVKKSPQQT